MNTSKIITAALNPTGYTVTAPIIKEDYGILLKIEGADLPNAYEVDFSNNEINGSSITVIGNADGVEIPQQLIKSGKSIYAFLYFLGNDYGKTVYRIKIPNVLRPDRTNEQPTPAQASALDQAINLLNGAVDSIEDMTATAETLAEGATATVTKTMVDGVVNLAFGIPVGATGETGPKGEDGKDGADGEDYVLTAEDRAEIAGIVEGDISPILNEKADTEGIYDGLTAGNLVTNNYAEDKVPYLLRASGGGVEVGVREYDKLVGGTVAWNQLATELSSDNWGVYSVAYSSVTFADGKATLTAVSDSITLNYQNRLNQKSYKPSGYNHKILLSATVNPSKAMLASLWIYGKTANGTVSGKSSFKDGILLTANADNRISAIINESHTDVVVFYPAIGLYGNTTYPVGTNDSAVIKDYIAIDLTAMFGSTIADYIYSLEQATAGAGVAWFRKLFPKDYYAYNAGELLSVKTVAHKTVGFNQWDEEWEAGGISISNGQNAAVNLAIRSKKYIPCVGGCAYYLKGAGFTRYVFWYDADKSFVSYSSRGSDGTVTAPTNAHYFRLRFDAYGTTYNHDICISLSSDRNGQYEAYQKHEYPLESFNVWDEEWEVYSNHIRSKNYNPCIGGASYYLKGPTVSPQLFANGFKWYDADKNLIGSAKYYANNIIAVAPDNAKYFKFDLGANYGTTYNHDICINISDPAKNGTYKPYFTLRGIPKLDSNNKLYYDGDTYEADGTVTRKYGIVDLGTLTWRMSSTGHRFYASDNNTNYKNRTLPALLITKYALDGWGNSVIGYYGDDKTIRLYNDASIKEIYIHDDAYSTAEEFKAAMSGVYLVYELAEPTTETVEPFTAPQLVDEYGTEEYVDDRDVPIPVGHVTRYPTNSKKKLDMIPMPPKANGTYVLQCVTSGGARALSWVAQT